MLLWGTLINEKKSSFSNFIWLSPAQTSGIALPKLGFCRAWSPLTLHGGFASLRLLSLLWAAFGTCTDFTTLRELHQCQSPPSRQALKPDCFIPLLIKGTRHGNEFSSPSFFFFSPYIPEEGRLDFFSDPPKRNHSNHNCNYIYISFKKTQKPFWQFFRILF